MAGCTVVGMAADKTLGIEATAPTSAAPTQKTSNPFTVVGAKIDGKLAKDVVVGVVDAVTVLANTPSKQQVATDNRAIAAMVEAENSRTQVCSSL